MAKSERQKLKLLYLMEYFMEKTDVEHPATTQDLIRYLAANEISAERKSIYSDVALLAEFGMDIEKSPEKPGGWYLASRRFELAELKLLVDAVQAAKFITTKKSRNLIAKLETLCSHAEARQLHRQVVVTDRNKAVNENIYYNVDFIYNAIETDVKIRFRYFNWNVDKKPEMSRDGAFYEVSPWLLLWDDENYYLVAYDAEREMMRHYRVDKMVDMEPVQDSERIGREVYEQLDIAGYAKKNFSMFAGEEQNVTLCCEKSLTGVMVDRFGMDVAMRQKDAAHILVHVDVSVSRQFFGWLAGLGTAVQIESPEDIRAAYRDYLQEVLDLYREF